MTAIERLNEIEARAAAATEGPWWRGTLQGADVYSGDGNADDCLVATDFRTPADGDFIAAARTDVPALVATVRAVLALHAPNGMPVNRCAYDRLPYDLCPTVRAIDAALDVTS